MMARSVMLAVLMLAAPVQAAKPKPPPPVPAPPPPSVRAGVDLWRAGDWNGAVTNWQPFAASGDPDAMFNMGQAYKLGRGVTLDKAVARDWYRKAATKGHLPAQANLGILLFQAGEKPEAARWLKTAADRGEMRAQYVLGVAHWNGDGVPRSLPLAYAYLARASAQGLTEATSALGNLTRTISPVERANGWAIATSLAAGNGVPPAYAPTTTPTTAAELNRMNLEAVQRPLPAPIVAAPPPVAKPPVVAATPPAISAAPPVVAAVKPPPTVASPPPAKLAAPAPAPVTPPVLKPAVVTPAAAPIATPAPVPVTAAAPVRPAAPEVRTVDIPSAKPVEVASVAAPAAKALPAEKPPAAKVAETAKPVDKTKAADAKPLEKGKTAEKAKPVELPPGWRVQLGAFGKQSQAETAWTEIKTKQKAAVGKAKPIYEPGTSIIKLQMGPYKTRDEAKDACAKMAFAGHACFVTEAAKGK